MLRSSRILGCGLLAVPEVAANPAVPVLCRRVRGGAQHHALTRPGPRLSALPVLHWLGCVGAWVHAAWHACMRTHTDMQPLPCSTHAHLGRKAQAAQHGTLLRTTQAVAGGHPGVLGAGAGGSTCAATTLPRCYHPRLSSMATIHRPAQTSIRKCDGGAAPLVGHTCVSQGRDG